MLALVVLVLSFQGCARAPHHKISPVPPIPVSSVQTMTAPGGFYYTMQKGDTLYHIAKMYHMNVAQLMRANHIDNASQISVGQRVFIPQAVRPTIISPIKHGRGMTVAEVSRLVGSKNSSSHWRTITVHHSGTTQGGAQAFDRDHRRRRMGGLFYHFVIGNGTQTRDGEIEVGFRWRRQIPANRPFDIQICVVGDFSKQRVSDAQYESMVNLINVLKDQYSISRSNLRGHGDIRGKHTECPGRNFPLSKLFSDVSS